MPIEFHCTACQQFLRVPDDAAGKQAKCPKCQQVLEVPRSSTGGGFSPLPSASAPPSPYSAPPPKDPYSVAGSSAPNPYAPPRGLEMKEPVIRGNIHPTSFDIGEVFSISWLIYKNNFGLCVGVVLLVIAIGFVVGMGFGMVNGMLQLAFRNEPAIFLGGQVVTQIAQQLFQIYLNAGAILFFLALTRQQRPEIGVIFGGVRFIGPLVLFNLILYGALALIVGVAMLPFLLTQKEEMAFLGFLAVVPIIYVMLTYGMGMLLIIDRDMGVLEALQTSALITPGNRLKFIILGLLMVVLWIAGLLACIVGIIFVIPFFQLLPVLAYRSMIGENIAATA